jgi:hypothetical protein
MHKQITPFTFRCKVLEEAYLKPPTFLLVDCEKQTRQ